MGRQELLILPVLKTLNAKKKIIKKQSGKQSSSKRKLSYGSMIAERRVYFNFYLEGLKEITRSTTQGVIFQAKVNR